MSVTADARSEALKDGGFVHLHTHTEYSMLDGAAKLDDLFAEAGLHRIEVNIRPENAASLRVAEKLHLREEGLRRAYPAIAFEPGHRALVQPDAFIVNPRALARAELAAAAAAGAVRADDTVVSIDHADGAARLTGASGAAWTARQVVLATGAASNATGLLPRPLRMDVYGATVVLAEVADPDALQMPTSMYLKFRDGRSLFGGIVMAPRPYPDGKWYIKVAGGSLRNHPLSSAEQIAAWARTGGDQGDIDEAAAMLADLLPGRALGPLRTSPCLVAETETDRPYIDRIDEHTVIAVEAERGAMSADEIGRLTANLSQGPWRDSIPHEVFRARWADDAGA